MYVGLCKCRSLVFNIHISISLDQAKEVHRSLKLAAGMFLNVKETLLPKLPPTDDKGADTDSRVVEAYAFQSQAEAQEGFVVHTFTVLLLLLLLLL